MQLQRRGMMNVTLLMSNSTRGMLTIMAKILALALIPMAFVGVISTLIILFNLILLQFLGHLSFKKRHTV